MQTASSRVARHQEGTPREIACAVLVSLVVLPIQVAKYVLGVNAEVADIVSECTDTSKDVTFTEKDGDVEEMRMYRRDAAVG